MLYRVTTTVHGPRGHYPSRVSFEGAHRRKSRPFSKPFRIIRPRAPITRWEFCTLKQVAYPAPSLLSKLLSSWKTGTGRLITIWRSRFYKKEIGAEPRGNYKQQCSRNQIQSALISHSEPCLRARRN